MRASFVELRQERRRAGGLSGRHVLYGMIGFFGVIFVVNGYFLYAALATHSGVVAQEPYRKGLAYNARIAAEERQLELGWADEVTVDRTGRVALVLAQRQGEPVRDLLVQGTIGRPSTAREDRQLRFSVRDGGYVAETGPLADGSWIVEIAARMSSAAEPVYRARRRVWLKP